MALIWYKYVNPWYLREFIFKYLGNWVTTEHVLRIAIISVLIDSLIGQYPKITIHLLYTSLYDTGGDISEAYNVWSSQIWPCMYNGWLYLPWYKIFLYCFIPPLFRNIFDNCFCAGWACIFSWIVHNTELQEKK